VGEIAQAVRAIALAAEQDAVQRRAHEVHSRHEIKEK
jgi:hypothetical protein